ncbi:DUF3006 family protein [Ornithinibacillus bavariensis]|uniref:DUF3006 domain-containing protein n=1 Tax=Ornithinibacillus bavariensis TaxID=545502 RepID=A0A920C5P3_9BACI|nr:DUF3006 family protein [Ornithinibacillus bavariensis]GIO27056.1 hypothetical protein J43TS3_16670 [Ornithinibacillus bavariensis]
MRYFIENKCRDTCITTLVLLYILSGFVNICTGKTVEVNREKSFKREHQGVVDRIEEKFYIILLENDNREIVVPIDKVEEEINPSTWVSIYFEDNRVRGISVDDNKTRKERRRLTVLRQQLNEKRK